MLTDSLILAELDTIKTDYEKHDEWQWLRLEPSTPSLLSRSQKTHHHSFGQSEASVLPRQAQPPFQRPAPTQPQIFRSRELSKRLLIPTVPVNKSMESLTWRVSFCHHHWWLWLWGAFLTWNNPRCRRALGASPVLCLGLTSSFLYLHFFQNMIYNRCHWTPELFSRAGAENHSKRGRYRTAQFTLHEDTDLHSKERAESTHLQF